MKRFLLAAFISMILPFTVSAQEFVDLIKTELNFEKRALVAEAMNISSSESVEFWNTYSDFELEIDRIGEKRLANIKKFAENFENMDDKIAGELAQTYFDVKAMRLKTYKKYYKKFTKVIPVKKTVRFFQIMDQVQLLIDLQIASESPLIE
jgi:hypothetical protein